MSGAHQSLPARRGSDLTDKQIAFAVRDGKAVSARLPDGDLVTGWVFGSDDFHWGIVSADGRITLVHKSVPSLEVTDHLLSERSTAVIALVEPVVRPFRDYVMRTHFKAAVPA